MDEAIRKMEQAGLEAYKKDLENNADLTSRSINEMIEKNNLMLAGSSDDSSKCDSENRSFLKKTSWYEVKAVDGRIYYWNTETDESIWEPPEVGYLTLKEQQMKRDYEGRQQLKEVEKQRELEGKLKIEQEKAEREEQRAATEREKLKAFCVKEEPEETPQYVGAVGPEMKPEPYGQWKVVEVKKEKVIDLQLPYKREFPLNVPIAEPEPIQRTFKEKTVKSLDVEDNCGKFQGFKKGN